MKRAADFRRIARDALNGRWGVAIVAGLLASLLGATGGSGMDYDLLLDDSSWLSLLPDGVSKDLILMIVLILLAVILVAVIVGFFVPSVIEIGYMRFNLDLVDEIKEASIGSVFGYFRFWKTAFCAKFLQVLYISLWSLLFIIPGIIASYSYAMTPYILAENPNLRASEAIEISKQMMEGNRWRLFCLQWSFIGWELLCLLTLGIGKLWLVPYTQAATAAFYREISGTEVIRD